MSLTDNIMASNKSNTKNDWDWDENDNKDKNNVDDDDAANDNWDDWADAEENVIADVEENTVTSTEIKDEKNAEIESNANAQTTNTNHNNNVDLNKNSEKSVSNSRSTGWGSLMGSWGGVVSTVLSTATEGLENITTSVTHGLDKVIGVPDPEEMARLNSLEEAQLKATENKEEQLANESNSNSIFGLNIVSGVTSLGSKVINTGLDTLEGIGKKTMDILQENDPMLRDKIKKITLEPEKTNLSEVLKQAKAENEDLEQRLKELKLQKTKEQLRFEVLFENYCGLVHLEALEILHKEANLKIQLLKESASPETLSDIIETSNEIKELMELEEFETEEELTDYDTKTLNEKLIQAIEDADLIINFDDLISLWSSILQWLEGDFDHECQNSDAIFAKAITCLSECCAIHILKLHKIAELLLIKEHHSTASEMDCIVQLCQLFINHLNTIANRFASKLNEYSNRNPKDQQQDDNPQEQDSKICISTLFAEMLNARSQIEKAFHLFLPILQIGAF